MAYYLVIHSGYKEVEFGLYLNNYLLSYKKDESKKVSANFINYLDTILKESNIALKKLSFIAVHQGPAPFTTLRVVLAYVNGLNFTTNLPLIGINGLEAIINEHSTDQLTTVALLNAFSNDLFYAVKEADSKNISFGYAPGLEFLKKIKMYYKSQIKFIGNGVKLFSKEIYEILGGQAVILELLPEIASLQGIASIAFSYFKNNKNISNELVPLYLKDIVATLPLNS
jgi:tRNA threonylcarbamoyladenosine biosynthesis protein TsaB